VDKIKMMFEKTKDLSDKQAEFKTAITVYDPKDKSFFVATGKLSGEIKVSETDGDKDSKWGYNKIFYVPELKKTYSEMTISQKNAISHRGKALSIIKYFLQDRYSIKHIVVPIGILIKDGKILLNKRNDPHRPSFHGKWETPGGGVEQGETMEACVVREVKEEAGYDVEIIERLNEIWQKEEIGEGYKYQVFLMPFVCKVLGGDGKYSDHEVMEDGWFSPEEVLDLDMVPDGYDLFIQIMPKLKEIISVNS
jgi:mutator protein MutT